MNDRIVRAAELVDTTTAARFVHDNPDFTLVDSNEVIEYLLDTDSLKYGRLCGEIKYMGIMIAAQEDDFRRGFIGIRTLPMKNCVLELVTEDMQLLAEWIKRFWGNISFCCNHEETKVLAYLHEQGIDINVKCRPHAVYQGSELKYTLPEFMQIRKLDESDLAHIQKWANGKNDAYVR